MKTKEEQIEDIKTLVDEMLDIAAKTNGCVWGHQLEYLDAMLHALAEPTKRRKMKSKKKKTAPKLPRFSCPKDMKSRVFKTKKDKAKSRANLKKLVDDGE